MVNRLTTDEKRRRGLGHETWKANAEAAQEAAPSDAPTHDSREFQGDRKGSVWRNHACTSFVIEERCASSD